MKLLVTGGCGFIGHHLVQHILINTDWSIVVIDKLTTTTKGHSRLREINAYPSSRVSLYTWDLCSPLSDGIVREIGDVDVIVHMAAETHVDNSIDDPTSCVHNNVMSTVHMLNYARGCKNLTKFLYFSTDEVFGPALGDTLYKEWDRHNPTNPYSASKSAAENICLAYGNTYGIPVVICNVMNVFGERQYAEKFIPLCIKQVLAGEEVLIHSYPGCQASGTRFYIHGRNVASAVLFLIQKGQVGDKYNIAGEQEVSNLDLARLIAGTLGLNLRYRMVDFHSKRPGHDLRYGLDGSKLRALGWQPPVTFSESMAKTINWTVRPENKHWLEL